MKTTQFARLLFAFQIISWQAIAQISGTVFAHANKKSIPFVNIWIKNGQVGTTTDIAGKFTLEQAKNSDTLCFSAIGFETNLVRVSEIDQHKPVYLTASDILLSEVVISSKKVKEKRLKIGSFNRHAINTFWQTGERPYILARKFDYNPLFEATPFIKSVKFYSKSDVKNATFNLRLYSINRFGEPGEFLYNENILVTASKGHSTLKIDLTACKLAFPKAGFFVAAEWLIIPENRYEYESRIAKNSPIKKKHVSYEPALGTIPTVLDTESYQLVGGKWRKVHQWKSAQTFENFIGKYSVLACELELTN